MAICCCRKRKASPEKNSDSKKSKSEKKEPSVKKEPRRPSDDKGGDDVEGAMAALFAGEEGIINFNGFMLKFILASNFPGLSFPV